jgi:DHA2 family multidrug resistance protein
MNAKQGMSMAQAAEHAHTIVPIDTQAPYYKWLVAGIILLAEGTQTLAGNSVNLAIPSLMAAFGTDLATTQWVTTGFLLARTLVIPILGWLGSVLGNRNLFVAIMTGFVVASLGCGLATNLPMLIGFRLLQGFVLGPMEGLSAVILVQAFPPQQRGLAIGLRTIGWAVGHTTTFTLGGYFLEQISWRLIFFMGIPSGILCVVLGLLLLPQQRDYRGEPVDCPGLLALGGFLVPLLLAISFGRDDTTAGSTLFLLLLGAFVGGSLFVLRELLTSYPAVDLRLFRFPAFCLICGTAFLNSMALFGAQFMVPIFLQQGMGFSPFQAGLIMVPALIMSGLSGVVSGLLRDLMPPRWVIVTGGLALTAVLYRFSSFTQLTSVGVLVGYIILYRFCMFAIFIPLTALNVMVLGPEQVRMGQGLLGVVRNIGASLGVTVTSVLFERRRIWHQLFLHHAYDENSVAHEATVHELKHLLHQAGIHGGAANWAALRTIRRQIDIEAIVAGFRDSFLFIGFFFFLASIPMLCLTPRRLGSTRQAQ